MNKHLPALLLLASMLGACTPPVGPVKVGVLAPLTGGAASYGENARKGAELALKDFSAGHPDVHVELSVEDSQGEAAAGTRAASKLVDLDGVVAIMGDVTSGVTMAVAPSMNEKKIPLISPGASSPNVTDAGEYVFRTWPSDVFEADAMVHHIIDAKIGKLALIRINNEYGVAMEAAIRAKLTGQPVSIVDAETFEQGAREMREQMLHVQAAQPDGIYFIGFPEAAVVFGHAYAETGMHTALFATSAFEDPQIPRDSGAALDGTVYTKPRSVSAGAGAFKKAYSTAYGADPGVVSDTAYDATMLILDAIAETEAAKTPVTGAAIQAELVKVKDYPGVSGDLSFDANGDVIKPIGLYTLQAGNFAELPK